jgi:DnaJ like chaperone protein
MGNFGKWIVGGLGWVVGGPIGGLLGMLVGSMVDDNTVEDSGYTAIGQNTAPGDFGVSLLVLIAGVMKIDGKVVKSELDYVKTFLVRQFGNERAKEALIVLKDLLKKDIPMSDVCYQIRRNMDYSSRLQLLHLLFNVSIADGMMHREEIDLMEKIYVALGVETSDYLSIKNMFIPETDSSYKILETEPTVTDEELKKAYRRMAMKYHPDKVVHLGEDFRRSADEKFKKVNEAYGKIKKERNIA